MGVGPYMGMGDKFLVLLLKKPANLARYGTKCGTPQSTPPAPIAINFLERGSLLFGTCPSMVKDKEDPDGRFHVHVQFNVSLQILRGYRFYSHSLPAWLEEGFANSYVIQRDPERHDFSGMKDWDQNRVYPGKWHVNSRRLAKNGYAPAGKALGSLERPGQMTFNDQICAWSRVDFMRSLDGGKKFAGFVKQMAAPMPSLAGKLPEFKTILEAQTKALKDVFGMSWEECDAAWKKYAIKTYPRRVADSARAGLLLPRGSASPSRRFLLRPRGFLLRHLSHRLPNLRDGHLHREPDRPRPLIEVYVHGPRAPPVSDAPYASCWSRGGRRPPERTRRTSTARRPGPGRREARPRSGVSAPRTNR